MRNRLLSIVRGHALGDLIGGPSALASLFLESVHRLERFDADDVLKGYTEWWIREGFEPGPVADAVFGRIAGSARVDEAVAAVHEQFGGSTAGCRRKRHRGRRLWRMPTFVPKHL